MAPWILGLILCSAFLGCLATPAEDMVDEMIYELNKESMDKHKDTLTIPNIDETFQKKISFVKVRGEFTATGGWFKNVSSIKRTGPLEMKQEGSVITLGINLGLGDMEFGFEEYRVEVFHIGIHGKMRVEVGDNSVFAHLTMNMPSEGPCHTTIDKIEVTKIDNFHVDMTGLGRDADWIYSYVVQLLANKFHDKLASLVSKKLSETAADALAKHDFCDKFGL